MRYQCDSRLVNLNRDDYCNWLRNSLKHLAESNFDTRAVESNKKIGNDYCFCENRPSDYRKIIK